MASPVIRKIASDSGFEVELANQTTYPDFTLTHKETNYRIALDVKTTYESARMLFTLGGYNSFLRNGTKNILHNYSTYSEHWILGFIYKQLDAHPVYDLDSMPKPGSVACPYEIVSAFLRQKHEITGLRAGSGNTKNIGSIKLNSATEFETAEGPFTHFSKAKEACDFYWRDYDNLKTTISTEAQLLQHQSFLQFK